MSYFVGEGDFVLGCVHHHLRNASTAIFTETLLAFPPGENVLNSQKHVPVRPLEAAQVGWPPLTDAGKRGPDGSYQVGS